MDLKVFDTELTPLGVIDEMVSLLWTPTYWAEGTTGDFKLLAPLTENNKKLLVKGNIVVLHDGKPEYTDETGSWRRAAQIRYRKIKRDQQGAEQIEVQGCFLKRWLSKRVILNKIVMTATEQEKINRIVTENHGSGAAARRQLPRFCILAQGDLGGSRTEYSNEDLVDAGKEIYTRSLAGKLGHDILVNENAGKYGFYLYKGKDLTDSNAEGNDRVVFSREMDNMSGQEYTESDEGVKNVVYVTGAEDEAGAVPVVEIDQGGEGLYRDEVHVEMSSISRTYYENEVEVTIPEAEYLKMLQAAGDDSLKDYGETLSFSAVIDINSRKKYGEDFNVGDRVTCIEKNWGIKVDVRITAVCIAYQNNIKEVEATLGDSLPTLIQQIQKEIKKAR